MPVETLLVEMTPDQMRLVHRALALLALSELHSADREEVDLLFGMSDVDGPVELRPQAGGVINGWCL